MPSGRPGDHLLHGGLALQEPCHLFSLRRFRDDGPRENSSVPRRASSLTLAGALHTVGRMPIGEERTGVTRICRAYPDRVEVRGRDLCADLMGRLTFTEYFHLLLTGREPSEEQRYFLDLLLVAIAEHGMMPTNVAARITLAADPGSLQGALAAGVLGAGPVILGTSEECALLLEQAQARVGTGESPESVATTIVSRIRDAGGRAPGFGHPVHRPLDPRAERILELADARGVSGPHVLLARCFRDAVHAAWPRRLPMNVSMPIAAVLLDLGFPASSAKAIPLLARTAGLLAHLAEEREQPVGFVLAGAAEDAVTYEA
jgi:citrate synthase